MTEVYKPKVTDGAPRGFNPRCNQMASPKGEGLSKTVPTVAERAAEGMKRHREMREGDEAYRRAMEQQKQQTRTDPQRWVSNEDLA